MVISPAMFSEAKNFICPSASRSTSKTPSADKKMAHLNGSGRPAFPTLARYVAAMVAPWEKARTPSNGPSAATYVSSWFTAARELGGLSKSA